MSEFEKVEPLNVDAIQFRLVMPDLIAVSDEADAVQLNVEQALALHAWLSRALRLEKEPRSETEAFDGGRLG